MNQQQRARQRGVGLYPVSHSVRLTRDNCNLSCKAFFFLIYNLTSVIILQHWQLVFDKYDLDSDGRISLAELRNMLRSESFENDIPKHTVSQIMEKADKNRNGYLEFPEFLKMVGNFLPLLAKLRFSTCTCQILYFVNVIFFHNIYLT